MHFVFILLGATVFIALLIRGVAGFYSDYLDRKILKITNETDEP